MQPRKLFEILVREHADMLTLYLESVVSEPALVDDLFQETFLVAWRRLDDFDQDRPFGPWLRGIARNLLLAHQRERARALVLVEEEVLELLDARCESLHQQPGDTLEEKLALLRECLDALPDRYRSAVRARYLDQARGQRLAACLETTVENAKKRLQRGRLQLQQCIERKLAPRGG